MVYDWNIGWDTTVIHVQDQTLRDGAQAISVRRPSIEDQRTLLHHAAALGLQAVELGFPATGARAAADVAALAREITDARLPLAATCAARTLTADIDPVTDAAQASGIPIEVALFLGASGLRQRVEGWTLDDMRRRAETTVAYAVRAGHPVMFVTEDTTRTAPETLVALYGAAIAAGARRLCLADTVGHATPAGVRHLVRFVREEIAARSTAPIALDWHGHRDRGLGLANCLAAIEAGVDRVHATALGLGERAGNVEMEPLLVNLRLLGAWPTSLETLPRYAHHAARAFGVEIPASYPVVGADAFTTGAGVHAAAIVKARAMGDATLVDRLYSGVPASDVGRVQTVRITPQSGMSTVRWWLEAQGFSSDDRLAAHILAAAKGADRALDDAEIVGLRAAYLSSSARPDARIARSTARA